MRIHLTDQEKDLQKCNLQLVAVEDFRVLRNCVDGTECRTADALCIKRFRPHTQQTIT